MPISCKTWRKTVNGMVFSLVLYVSKIEIVDKYSSTSYICVYKQMRFDEEEEIKEGKKLYVETETICSNISLQTFIY